MSERVQRRVHGLDVPNGAIALLALLAAISLRGDAVPAIHWRRTMQPSVDDDLRLVVGLIETSMESLGLGGHVRGEAASASGSLPW